MTLQERAADLADSIYRGKRTQENAAKWIATIARDFAVEALRAYVDDPYNAQQTDAQAITAAISRAEKGEGR